MLLCGDSDDSVARFLLQMDVLSVTTVAYFSFFSSSWNITLFIDQLQFEK